MTKQWKRESKTHSSRTIRSPIWGNLHRTTLFSASQIIVLRSGAKERSKCWRGLKIINLLTKTSRSPTRFSITILRFRLISAEELFAGRRKMANCSTNGSHAAAGDPKMTSMPTIWTLFTSWSILKTRFSTSWLWSSEPYEIGKGSVSFLYSYRSAEDEPLKN